MEVQEAGKSTVVNLIPRFYDVTNGELLVDGVNVKDVSQKELRKRIGFVPQRGVLFSGTIESNIKYGNSLMSDEQMKKAIENGICKVNIFSEILEAFFSEFKKELNELDNMSLWPSVAYNRPIEALKRKVKEKFALCGCINKV